VGKISIALQRAFASGDALGSPLGPDLDESEPHLALRVIGGQGQRAGPFRFGLNKGRDGLGTDRLSVRPAFEPELNRSDPTAKRRNAASMRMRRARVQHQPNDKANDRLHDQAGDIGERGAEQARGDHASGHRATEVE
jgi:hypothetical protein